MGCDGTCNWKLSSARNPIQWQQQWMPWLKSGNQNDANRSTVNGPSFYCSKQIVLVNCQSRESEMCLDSWSAITLTHPDMCSAWTVICLWRHQSQSCRARWHRFLECHPSGGYWQWQQCCLCRGEFGTVDGPLWNTQLPKMLPLTPASLCDIYNYWTDQVLQSMNWFPCKRHPITASVSNVRVATEGEIGQDMLTLKNLSTISSL